ncbi:hypothetical protein MXB_2011, partial [Myxobolus squamalis]
MIYLLTVEFRCYLSKSLKAQIGINIDMNKLLSFGILYALPGNLLSAHPQLIIPRINSSLSYHKSTDSRYTSSLRKRAGSFSFSVPIRLSHNVSLESIGPFSIFGFFAYN